MRLTTLSSVTPERAIDDALLVRRVAEGDLSGLGELYDRYAGPLLRFAARMATWSEAEDIVQEVFLRVLRLAGDYDPGAASARPWLYALTLRATQEHRRAFRRWTSLLGRFYEQPPRELATLRETRPDIERALARLSPAKREVLLLAEVEGFGASEIASLLGIPVGTVWTRLHHARLAMRKLLESSL
jgi:RNA polymerase sigma-70 factor, ECF subfamily